MEAVFAALVRLEEVFGGEGVQIDRLMPLLRDEFECGEGTERGGEVVREGGGKDAGGGAGAGVKIDPVAFLVIKDGSTRVLPVAVPPVSTMDRIVEMAPDIMDKVEKFFDKKEAKETL